MNMGLPILRSMDGIQAETITDLSLFGFSINDAAAVDIASFIAKFTNLASLDLSRQCGPAYYIYDYEHNP